MASNSPYQIPTNGGPVKNVTSTTAPSLTDPAANSAYKNQMVTVGSDVYFVDSTGKAQKMGSSGSTTSPEIPAAVAIGTQAQLNAIADKQAGEKYIVTDGTNKGDILSWEDTNDDGVADAFVVYLTPPALTNNTEYTVLTNKTGEPAGVYTYDLATDTWYKTGDVDPVIPPVDDATAVGGIKMAKQRFNARDNSGNIWIQADHVAGYGISSGASGDGRNTVGNSTSTNFAVRKAGASLHSAASPYAQLINYRPYAYDVVQNQYGGVMIDHKGNFYANGAASFVQYMLGYAAAPSSSGYIPDAFWANSTAKVVDVALAAAQYQVLVVSSDGKVWSRGSRGGTGVYGDGTVAQNSNWHQVNVPVQGYKKIMLDESGNLGAALSKSGDFYAWGTNTGNRINSSAATSIISTPVRVAQNVKDFSLDTNSVMLILNDGSRLGVGTNTNGKLGNGTTTALTTYTALPSNGFTFESVVSTVETAQNNGYYYITTDKKAVMTGYENRQRGIGTGAAGSNVLVPTLMGTGAYQGYVVDIHPHVLSTLIHTSLGEVWVAVINTTYGEGGVGIDTLSGANIGINVYRKVNVPGAVIKVSSNSDTTSNAAAYLAHTSEGRLYHWGGVALNIDGSSEYRFLPVELPTQVYRQDEPKASEVVNQFA